MIEHIVLLKLKSEIREEKISAMLNALYSLKDKIDGIIDLTAGANISPERAQGFSHGLVVRFQERADLEAYIPHPAHQSVVQEHIKPNVDDVLVIDFVH